MDKRNTGKEKLKKNKYFPYKSYIQNKTYPISKEDYFLIGKEDKEFIESFRLKVTALNAAQNSIKRYGRPVVVVTASEYKEMCNDQKGTT